MSLHGVAQALLSQQRATLFGKAYDLTQPESFDAAVIWLAGVLEEAEEIMRKEDGWVERKHEPAPPVRTEEPNPFPIMYYPGFHGLEMDT